MTGSGILIVPEYRPNHGGGHLCRCIELTCDLRARGRAAWLFLPPDAETGDLFQTMNFNPQWRITDEQITNKERFEFVILDRFQTSCEELSNWKKISPVIGIDEGGKCRDSFDFLIDILVPEKLGVPPANITSVSLLKFPPKALFQKHPSGDVLKVLITFGQEDSAGLGQKTARALSATDGMDIALLRGALSKGETEYPPNVRVIEAIPRLAEHLGEYDLVITHYGITAFEALYARTMVMLASPTAYHAKLARAAGFYSWECGMRNEECRCCLKSARNGNQLHLPTSLSTPHFINKLKTHCQELAARFGLDRDSESLADLFSGFSPQVYRHCPVCGTDAPVNSVCRFSDRTYRRCGNCGVIFMDRTCPPPIEYGKDYFFESYKKQYGKTYLEDFPNIKAEGKRRLKIINSFLPVKKSGEARTLLDIGCAYGPFLAAAREEGFSPAGIDPSEDAIRYVQQELSIPAVQGFFPHSPLPIPNSSFPIPHSPFPISHSSFNAVTLWFVIEHFTDLKAVLAEIKKILKPGGILAFSTPSFSGVSGRSSLRRFLSVSPADHFTIWSPAMCKKALALYGFRVKKTVSIGHHPERFPLFGKFANSKKSPLYKPLMAISKLFGLGDTFEVYAKELKRKKK
jgi:2-polyprenyl-3-methyl-5-hydroxy-6-metoxy-1,4-benzoquinol methylase/spore coat polysaccharide biosynthesis predicted glycosyltransferase SpsG